MLALPRSKNQERGWVMSNSGKTMNFRIAQRDLNRVLHLFDTSLDGLTETEANQRLSHSSQ